MPAFSAEIGQQEAQELVVYIRQMGPARSPSAPPSSGAGAGASPGGAQHSPEPAGLHPLKRSRLPLPALPPGRKPPER
jgi:hypothetical protein